MSVGRQGNRPFAELLIDCEEDPYLRRRSWRGCGNDAKVPLA
jgi:hypothetical protein